MYNRYIPNANGVYTRQSVPEPDKKKDREEPDPGTVCEPAPVKTEIKKTPKNKPDFDTGDLLLLCIILLLLLDSEEDMMTLVITAATFLFL